MSSWVLAWAWAQSATPGVSDGAKLLLCYMADQADDDGIVGLFRAVSRAALAQLFDVSVDTIDRRVGELKKAELVAVEKRSRPGPQGGVLSLPNVYRLASPTPPSAQGRSFAALDEDADFSQGRTDAAVEPPGPQQVRPPQPQSSAATLAATGAATLAAPVAAHKEPSTSTSTLLGDAHAWPPVGDPAVPRVTMSRKADWLIHVLAHPLLDPLKAAGLVSSAFEVDRWVTAGADLEQVVVPVLAAELQRREAAGKGPIKTWRLVTEDVRAAAALYQRPLERFAATETRDGRDHLGAAGAGQRTRGPEPGGMLGAVVRLAKSGG